MTAPALVMVAHGSDNPQVVQTFHTMRHQMQSEREELSIHLAFLDKCPPTGPQVVNTLSSHGVNEICFVPLNITRAFEADEDTEKMVANVRSRHPELSIGLSRPLGPEAKILNIIDERLRQVLSQRRVSELDGLVLSVPDLGDVRGAGLINRRVRQWASHHKLPVQLATRSGEHSMESAISTLRAQGRRMIAVGSAFLAADDDYLAQCEAAYQLGAVAVSAPFGADQRVMSMAIARYAYAAMALLDLDVNQDVVAAEDTSEAQDSMPIAVNA